MDISVKYSRRSFTSIVPYSVVQIWFTYNESQIGDHPKEWERYCPDHGYEYKLWTHRDMRTIEEILKSHGTWNSFVEMMRHGAVKSMSDILRYSLMFEYRGHLCGCGFSV